MSRFFSRSTSRAAAHHAGFTLIELMIVLAILLALFGLLLGPRIAHAWRQSQCKDTVLAMQQINGAVVQYQADHNGDCPTSLADLKSQKAIPSTKDQYGNEIVLTCPGQVNADSFDIVSPGPDHKLNTTDDITFSGDTNGICDKVQ